MGSSFFNMNILGKSLIFDFKTTYEQIFDLLSRYIIKFNKNDQKKIRMFFFFQSLYFEFLEFL